MINLLPWWPEAVNMASAKCVLPSRIQSKEHIHGVLTDPCLTCRHQMGSFSKITFWKKTVMAVDAITVQLYRLCVHYFIPDLCPLVIVSWWIGDKIVPNENNRARWKEMWSLNVVKYRSLMALLNSVWIWMLTKNTRMM